jgi:hypothetical protein
LIAKIFCVGLAIWSWRSPSTGLPATVAFAWTLGLLLYALHAVTKPSSEFAKRFFLGDQPGSLSHDQVRTFQRYHIWFVWTLVSEDLASSLAVLRFASLIAAIASLFAGYYVTAGCGVAAFVAFGPLTITLNPPSWLGPRVSQGAASAVQEASILRRLSELRANREQEERRAFADKRIQELATKQAAGKLSAETYEAEKAELDAFAARSRSPATRSGSQMKSIAERATANAWGEILNSGEVAIREVLIPLGIYPRRFFDNMIFLESHGMEFMLPKDQPMPTPTPSLARSPHRLEWPVGQPTWFIAAFPDVSQWVSDTISRADFDGEPEAIKLVENRNQRLEELLEMEGVSPGDADEATINSILLDSNGKTSPKQCRLVAEWYRESTGRVFEAGVP